MSPIEKHLCPQRRSHAKIASKLSPAAISRLRTLKIRRAEQAHIYEKCRHFRRG